jgi:hypothetical protein
LVPQAILDYRRKTHTKEVLVHWHEYSPGDATWEKVTTMARQFLEFVLEDMDSSKGGGML